MKPPVVLAVLLGTLVLACSTVAYVPAEPAPNTNTPATLEPTPNIDATAEAKLAQEKAVDATVQVKVPSTLSAQLPKTSNETHEVCKLTGGGTVESGWTGKDTANSSCNSCFCRNGAEIEEMSRV